MRFVEAVYGSPSEEIRQRGGDPAKGRLNGNLFLSAFVFLGSSPVPAGAYIGFRDRKKIFRMDEINIWLGGRVGWKILATGIWDYLFCDRKYNGQCGQLPKHTEAFLQYPEAERKKPTGSCCCPFSCCCCWS